MHPAHHPKRVLVADDDPGAARLLADLLALASPTSIEVYSEINGVNAVSSSLANTPDMAILDIEMPGMDGVEAAFAIRAALGADAPLLIALSGNLVRIGDARTRGAFDHTFCKPVSVNQLLALIDSLA